jgi:hypothetical protein
VSAPVKKLAIVGSTTFANQSAWIRAREIIDEELATYAPDFCISGGAPYIDSLFRRTAMAQGFDKLVSLRPDDWWRSNDISPPAFIEFLPREDILTLPPGGTRWVAVGGYMERNICIATLCTRLVAIRSSSSGTYGSGWTHNYAKKLGGKETRMEVL